MWTSRPFWKGSDSGMYELAQRGFTKFAAFIAANDMSLDDIYKRLHPENQLSLTYAYRIFPKLELLGFEYQDMRYDVVWRGSQPTSVDSYHHQV